MFVVVGSLVLIVGEAVSPVFDLVGENVGNGVGGDVVLWMSLTSSARSTLPWWTYRPSSIVTVFDSKATTWGQ